MGLFDRKSRREDLRWYRPNVDGNPQVVIFEYDFPDGRDAHVRYPNSVAGLRLPKKDIHPFRFPEDLEKVDPGTRELIKTRTE